MDRDTTFEVDSSHPGVRLGLLGLDPPVLMTVGHAEDRDGHEMIERAEPKPDCGLVRVLKNARKVVEIRRDEDFNDDIDDSVDIDELLETWELMAADGAEESSRRV